MHYNIIVFYTGAAFVYTDIIELMMVLVLSYNNNNNNNVMTCTYYFN